jgi:hypothetical protein
MPSIKPTLRDVTAQQAARTIHRDEEFGDLTGDDFNNDITEALGQELANMADGDSEAEAFADAVQGASSLSVQEPAPEPEPDPAPKPPMRTEATRHFLNGQIGDLTDRKRLVERHIADVNESAIERIEEIKADTVVCIRDLEAELREIAAHKEAFELALARLNRG